MLDVRSSLDQASPSDPVFDDLPDLYESLCRKGLLHITAENLRPGYVGADAAFWIGQVGLLPHPRLAPYRELLHVLAELATDPSLTVSIAINPFITRSPDDGTLGLIEDQWYGLHLTTQTLDSLDRHDTGSSFHAAGERSMAEELFHPLLGTHFDWRARNDDPTDPIKRLYIQEVRPARDRPDEENLIAVFNRALHAERDTSIHQFTHVDGKTCRYAVEDYPPCRENPMLRLPSPTHQRKLWRVDGPMRLAAPSTRRALVCGRCCAAAVPFGGHRRRFERLLLVRSRGATLALQPYALRSPASAPTGAGRTARIRVAVDVASSEAAHATTGLVATVPDCACGERAAGDYVGDEAGWLGAAWPVSAVLLGFVIALVVFLLQAVGSRRPYGGCRPARLVSMVGPPTRLGTSLPRD